VSPLVLFALVLFARVVFARVVFCAPPDTNAPETAIRRDITLTECFIMASFLVLGSDPLCGSSEATSYYW